VHSLQEDQKYILKCQNYGILKRHAKSKIDLGIFQEINSFGWYNNTVKNLSITTKHLYLILTFRSYHQIFIRSSLYSVLPSLDTTISCRIKKAEPEA